MLTCAPNPVMEKIHNRMPVILHKCDYDSWLGEGGDGLLVPYMKEMTARVVAEPKPPKLPKPLKPIKQPQHQQGELF
jgi:putative SOS response-associated peptidase YedK